MPKGTKKFYEQNLQGEFEWIEKKFFKITEGSTKIGKWFETHYFAKLWADENMPGWYSIVLQD